MQILEREIHYDSIHFHHHTREVWQDDDGSYFALAIFKPEDVVRTEGATRLDAKCSLSLKMAAERKKPIQYVGRKVA